MTSVAVPALDTERTAMRAFAERDLDPYAAMVADPETMRFVGGVGSREEAWRRAWSELGVTRLISIIDPVNERSLAVARRLGMAPLRDHLHHGTPVVLYAIECPAG